MPDLLGYVIQVLQLLRAAQLGWLANSTLVIMVLLGLLYLVAFVIYSPRVQKLLKAIVKSIRLLKPQLSEAMSSPYDLNLKDSKVFIGMSMIMYYYFSLGMIIYSILLLLMTGGYFIEGQPDFGQQMLTFLVSGMFCVFARYFKCQGDKELFKLRK